MTEFIPAFGSSFATLAAELDIVDSRIRNLAAALRICLLYVASP